MAIILIIVIVIAAVVLYQRRQRGLTIKNSTFGNDVNGNIGEATPSDNRSPRNADEMQPHATVSRNADDRPGSQ
ncbi:MAG TPA: hypothetical protein VGN15_10730 [Ktedonobacteraceae bacterium]|nr:hypothetical protein [Ktedonobacteraceae bacterium]